MSNLTIQLDPVALREATGQAIMGILTPEVRAQILQAAIDSLLRPSTDSWNKGKSPIEQAFEQAVTQTCRDLAREYVANDPELMGRLRKLLADTAAKVLDCDTDKMAERMADAFTSSMRRD